MKNKEKIGVAILIIIATSFIAGFLLGTNRNEDVTPQKIVALYRDRLPMTNSDAMCYNYIGVYDPDLEEVDILSFTQKIKNSLEEEFDSEEFEVEAWVPSMHDFMMSNEQVILFTVHMDGELLEQYSYYLTNIDATH